jgi:hypothetical protein
MARQFDKRNGKDDEYTFVPEVRPSASSKSIVIDAPVASIYLTEDEARQLARRLNERLSTVVPRSYFQGHPADENASVTGRTSSGGPNMLEQARDAAHRLVEASGGSVEELSSYVQGLYANKMEDYLRAMSESEPGRLSKLVSDQLQARGRDRVTDSFYYRFMTPPTEETIARIREEADRAFDAAMGGPEARRAAEQRERRLAEVDRLEALANELERQLLAAEDPDWA